jgi:hypothetical protein
MFERVFVNLLDARGGVYHDAVECGRPASTTWSVRHDRHRDKSPPLRRLADP